MYKAVVLLERLVNLEKIFILGILYLFKAVVWRNAQKYFCSRGGVQYLLFFNNLLSDENSSIDVSYTFYILLHSRCSINCLNAKIFAPLKIKNDVNLMFIIVFAFEALLHFLYIILKAFNYGLENLSVSQFLKGSSVRLTFWWRVYYLCCLIFD